MTTDLLNGAGTFTQAGPAPSTGWSHVGAPSEAPGPIKLFRMPDPADNFLVYGFPVHGTATISHGTGQQCTMLAPEVGSMSYYDQVTVQARVSPATVNNPPVLDRNVYCNFRLRFQASGVTPPQMVVVEEMFEVEERFQLLEFTVDVPDGMFWLRPFFEIYIIGDPAAGAAAHNIKILV